MISKEELEKLKSHLHEEKAKLEKQIKGLQNTDFGDDVDSGDEESDEVEEKLANESIAFELQKRLNGINLALDKIAAGSYGACEKCEKEISLNLLKADPESRLCKDCKQKESE